MTERAEIEAVARAIHRVTPVALLVSHPTQMRLLEWEEESERRKDVWRRMAWAALDCVRAASHDDEVIRPRLGGGWECVPSLQGVSDEGGNQ